MRLKLRDGLREMRRLGNGRETRVVRVLVEGLTVRVAVREAALKAVAMVERARGRIAEAMIFEDF